MMSMTTWFAVQKWSKVRRRPDIPQLLLILTCVKIFKNIQFNIQFTINSKYPFKLFSFKSQKEGREDWRWSKVERPEEGGQEGHWITCASKREDESGWGTPKGNPFLRPRGKPGAQPGKPASIDGRNGRDRD